MPDLIQLPKGKKDGNEIYAVLYRESLLRQEPSDVQTFRWELIFSHL